MALDDKDILERYNDCMGDSYDGWNTQHQEIFIDNLFLDGKYRALLESGYLEEDMTLVNINEIKPLIDSISGFFRQVRRPIKLSSLNSDPESAMKTEVMNNALDKQRSNTKLNYVESDQDRDMIGLGLGFIDNSVSFIDDPFGAIKSTRVRPKYVRFDLSSEERNLEDGNFINHTKVFRLQDALKLIKGSVPDDFLSFDGVKDLSGNINNSSPVKYTPASALLNSSANFSINGQLVTIDQFHFRYLIDVLVYRNPIKQLVEQGNMEYAQYLFQTFELIKKQLDEDDNEYGGNFDPMAPMLEVPRSYKDLMDRTIAFVGQPNSVSRERYCYHTGLIGNQKVLKQYKSIYQDGFQLQAKTGFRDDETGTWYGYIRSCREPSSYVNKIRTDMMYVLEHAAKNTVLYNQDAVDDAVEFEELSAEHGARIGVNDINGFRVMEPPQRTGYEGLYSIMENLPATKGVGMNLEWFGQSPNKAVSAAFESQRISQVTSVLADPMDSSTLGNMKNTSQYSEYIRYLARINPEFTASFKDDEGNVASVLLTNDITDMDYEVEMHEVPLTTTMKQLTANMLSTMAMNVASTTGNISGFSVALDAYQQAGVDSDLINKMKEAISPQPTPEQQQAQQMQMQEAIEMAQLEKEKKAAEITEKQAKAEQTVADTRKTLTETEILEEKPLSEVNASA